MSAGSSLAAIYVVDQADHGTRMFEAGPLRRALGRMAFCKDRMHPHSESRVCARVPSRTHAW